MSDSVTVEEIIHKAVDLDDQQLQGIKLEDLEVYLADETGEIEEDLPAIDKSQIVSKVNYDKFVIVAKEILSHKNSQKNNNF